MGATPLDVVLSAAKGNISFLRRVIMCSLSQFFSESSSYKDWCRIYFLRSVTTSGEEKLNDSVYLIEFVMLS